MDIFFDYLKSKGLTPEKAHRTLHKWDDKKIVAFIDEAIERIPVDNRKATSIFDYVANSQLSGGHTPCANLPCRLKHSEELIRIAALYADRVLIRNPFTEYQHRTRFNDHTKENIINDIIVLNNLKPLLDEQIIGITKNDFHFCPDCYDNVILSKNENLNVRVGDVRELLTKKFLSDCKFTLNKSYGEFGVSIKGPSNLLDHTSIIIFSKVPQNLQPLFKKFKSKKLSEKDINESHVIDTLIAPILDDLILQNWYSNMYGSNYLTDREIDMDIIHKINDSSTNKHSNAIYDALSHSVPFIQQCDIKDVLRIRANEGDSFNVYRDALTTLIKKTEKIDSQHLKEAFDDEIRPELNKIDLIINRSSKSTLKGLARNITIGGCFIGVSLYSGILPANIGEIVAALGGFKYVSNITDDVSKIINKSDLARDNKYYFLWKIREKSKQ